MSETSPQMSAVEVKEEERLASCFNCKKSKVKCVRAEGLIVCSRCTLRKLDCRAPLFHVGRHKGVKKYDPVFFPFFFFFFFFSFHHVFSCPSKLTHAYPLK